MKKLIFQIFFLLSTLCFVASCSSPNIARERFIGKSKAEVLDIIFKENPPRVLENEVNIATMAARSGKGMNYQNYYYKTKEDALADKKLMDANIWDVDKRKKFSISIFQKIVSTILYFKEDKVVESEECISHHT
jgi:hypothetical protein